MRRHSVIFCALAIAATACTTQDGDGPRYVGRVVTVNSDEICVGPNSSSSDKTCGALPADPPPLPSVGDCVALFAPAHGDGEQRTWTRTSLSLDVDQDRCDP